MFSALHLLRLGGRRPARTGASLMGHDGSRHGATGHQKPLLGQEVEICMTTCEFVPAGQRGSLTPQLLPIEACQLFAVVDETGVGPCCKGGRVAFVLSVGLAKRGK